MVAVYLHEEILETSRPAGEIQFMGKSQPFYAKIRTALLTAIPVYPQIPLRMAEIRDYLRVHTREYLSGLKAMADEVPGHKPVKMAMDCNGLEFCLPGYQYSLGGMFETIDRMRAGTLERAYCMSLGGHHAHADWGHGYCLLNPLAATAKYAQEKGFKKVLMVDWDLHHGNGTQAIFAGDRDVYCISIHSGIDLFMSKSVGLYSGTTVAAAETGHCNIPLADHDFSDELIRELNLEGDFFRKEQSLPLFNEALEKIPWQPDLILLFSGYDSHRDDCGMDITDWTEPDYRKLTRAVLNLSKRVHCPVLSVHGGGYNLPVTVASAAAHLAELALP